MRNWGKKGFFETWVEVSFFALLVIGFVLGKLILDTAISYIIIAAAGLIVARLGYKKRENDPLPYYATGIGFLLGFLLGHRAGNSIAMIILYSTAVAATYHLHKNIEFLS